MKQTSMFRNRGRHPEASIASRVAKHEHSNSATAEIILSDIQGSGGEGSISVVWARLVLGRAAAQQCSFFDQEAA